MTTKAQYPYDRDNPVASIASHIARVQANKPRCTDCGCYLAHGKCPACSGNSMRKADAYIWRHILGIEK